MSEYRPDPLHGSLILTDLLSGIAPAFISPALAGMAAIAAWPWRQPLLQAAAGLLTFLTILGDWVSLALLPRFRRSFGPVTPPLLGLALLRAALILALGALWPAWPALVLAVTLLLALSGAAAYATWVEPFRLGVTRLQVKDPRLEGPAPLRLLHISDIHFEGWTPRERQLIQLVQELAPHAILMTGDYLNLSSVHDPAAQSQARELLAALAQVAPTYAITGSPPVDVAGVVPEVFADLPITWLLDRVAQVELEGRLLQVVGLRCTRNRQRDGARLRQLLPHGAGETFTVLLYHSPDLMPDAVGLGIDLYLAGHTHGGQMRLPLFGALVTSSDFGKRYEGGLYREGRTTLYVSRGIGMEGMGAPRARFLAPPEVTLLTLPARFTAEGTEKNRKTLRL